MGKLILATITSVKGFGSLTICRPKLESQVLIIRCLAASTANRTKKNASPGDLHGCINDHQAGQGRDLQERRRLRDNAQVRARLPSSRVLGLGLVLVLLLVLLLGLLLLLLLVLVLVLV